MAESPSRFDTAVNTATGIFAEDLSYAELRPIPYLNRLRSEEIVLGCIQLGDLDLLEQVIRTRGRQGDRIHVGTLSKNALNQIHYLGVVAVALASRAAISAGVPESISMALGDSFIQQVDLITLPEDVEKFYYDVFRGFCRLVHNYKTMELSAPVRLCCDYMLMKMYSTITLQDLSEICHLSPNYISDLFRKELDMGAIQYFHSLKMGFASYLLMNTSLTVAEISALLGYCSQSLFTQKFKKAYGLTPAKYRTQQVRKFPGQINDVTEKILHTL